MSCSVTMLACLRSLSRDTAGSRELGQGKSQGPHLGQRRGGGLDRVKPRVSSFPCVVWDGGSQSTPTQFQPTCYQEEGVSPSSKHAEPEPGITALGLHDTRSLQPVFGFGKGPCSNPQYTDPQLHVKMSLHTQFLYNSDSFHVIFLTRNYCVK